VPRTAKVVAFSTTPEMAEEIDRLAVVEGRTRSELLREAFRAYLATARDAGFRAAEARVGYPPSPPAPLSLPGLARVLGLRAEIARACSAAGVERLWVFGSAVRDDFDPARSDFDFLVTFRADAPRKPWLGELFELQDELSNLLAAPVELGEAGGLKNPYVRASVDAQKVLVYECS
jgi:uncharacterized protein